MNFIRWIRDLFGIQKDMYETKKTRLQIDEIERKERERTLITPATLEDVRRYDPKIINIERNIPPPPPPARRPSPWRTPGPGYEVLQLMGCAGVLLLLLLILAVWWFGHW